MYWNSWLPKYLLVAKITDGRADGTTGVKKLIQRINFTEANSYEENCVNGVTPLVHGETLIVMIGSITNFINSRYAF